MRRAVRQAWVAASIIGLAGVLPAAQTASPAAAPPRFYAIGAGSVLVDQGLALPAPTGSAAAAFQQVAAPSVRNAPNSGYAQATLAPWVESNAWRFQRGLQQVSYAKLPRGAAGLAAAEAFAFNVEAILDPDPADVQELGLVLRFLKSHERPPLPILANIGVIDDGSPAMGEVLNMLTRRNLLYRVVAQPDRQLDFTIRLGTRDFPAGSASNPSDFAARVREKLGDDRRLVRLFGTSTTIARLTGDGTRARLVLLSCSRTRVQEDLRVRLLGRWQPAGFAAYGAASGVALADVQRADKLTEFTVPTFSTIAIVDLDRAR